MVADAYIHMWTSQYNFYMNRRYNSTLIQFHIHYWDSSIHQYWYKYKKRPCFVGKQFSERNSELFSLPRNVSERNSESFASIFSTVLNSEHFSLPRNGFGTEFRDFCVPRNRRNSVGINQFFRQFRLPQLPTLVMRPLVRLEMILVKSPHSNFFFQVYVLKDKTMDQISIKTPNPKCRLFLKIYQ